MPQRVWTGLNSKQVRFVRVKAEPPNHPSWRGGGPPRQRQRRRDSIRPPQFRRARPNKHWAHFKCILCAFLVEHFQRQTTTFRGSPFSLSLSQAAAKENMKESEKYLCNQLVSLISFLFLLVCLFSSVFLCCCCFFLWFQRDNTHIFFCEELLDVDVSANVPVCDQLPEVSERKHSGNCMFSSYEPQNAENAFLTCSFQRKNSGTQLFSSMSHKKKNVSWWFPDKNKFSAETAPHKTSLRTPLCFF